ncbi:MAG: PAS domain-containing protein [Candidatus Omnitrophica bacterium]|nr:PAS domain-containing protein [Candidatus Omnitrophota bacterium]
MKKKIVVSKKRARQMLDKGSIISNISDQLRIKRQESARGKTHNELSNTVNSQADALKVKNVQIKQWADKEQRAEAQIHIRTKAMDAATDGIFIIDVKNKDFSVIYSNQAFQTMVGYSRKDIIGKNYFLLYADIADLRIAEEIKNTLQKDESFQGEMLNFRKNGDKFWNYLRISCVRDVNGVVTHYVGIQTDVTLMRRKDFEIKEQREELLHVTRVGKLAEFVSSLAHEISQPLTSILSYAQAAYRMLEGKDSQLQEILQYIINDDQRAAEVIRRLRSLLKKSDPEVKPIDINKLINETIELMATDVTVRNKVIKIALEPKLPNINGDRIQLQQVLLNLISNSLDAMEGRDEFRELSIRTSLNGSEEIIVEVKDSGCGIPKENMKKLFSHFFTSKPDGLGMGLSISRSIIEAHGGRLEVKNNPEGGAIFYFTIPVGGGVKEWS